MLVWWRVRNKGDPVYRKNLKPCKEIWVKLSKIRLSNRPVMGTSFPWNRGGGVAAVRVGVRGVWSSASIPAVPS